MTMLKVRSVEKSYARVMDAIGPLLDSPTHVFGHDERWRKFEIALKEAVEED